MNANFSFWMKIILESVCLLSFLAFFRLIASHLLLTSGDIFVIIFYTMPSSGVTDLLTWMLF